MYSSRLHSHISRLYHTADCPVQTQSSSSYVGVGNELHFSFILDLSLGGSIHRTELRFISGVRPARFHEMGWDLFDGLPCSVSSSKSRPSSYGTPSCERETISIGGDCFTDVPFRGLYWIGLLYASIVFHRFKKNQTLNPESMMNFHYTPTNSPWNNKILVAGWISQAGFSVVSTIINWALARSFM